jgi:hypothetical protein
MAMGKLGMPCAILLWGAIKIRKVACVKARGIARYL